MKKNKNSTMELEVLKKVVRRNKIKNTGESIDDIVLTLIENGLILHSANK